MAQMGMTMPANTLATHPTTTPLPRPRAQAPTVLRRMQAKPTSTYFAAVTAATKPTAPGLHPPTVALLALQAGYAADKVEKAAAQSGTVPDHLCRYYKKHVTKQGIERMLKHIDRPLPARRPLAPVSPNPNSGTLYRVEKARVEKAHAMEQRRKLLAPAVAAAEEKRIAAMDQQRISDQSPEAVAERKARFEREKRKPKISERSLMGRLAAGNAKKFAPESR